MSLSNVWLQTLGDGLVRADQVTGIDAHQTPALTGKRPHWLLDVVLPTPTGSGTRGEWGVSVLHRTLAQTSRPPVDAPVALARLLAQLDAVSAAGVVTTSQETDGGDPAGSDAETRAADGSALRFRFAPFETPSARRTTTPEYL